MKSKYHNRWGWGFLLLSFCLSHFYPHVANIFIMFAVIKFAVADVIEFMEKKAEEQPND